MKNIKKTKSVGVIGRGRWGKKVIKILIKYSSVKYIIGKNTNYKKCSPNVDWIFILTPNNTHYKICKFFLEKKVNVFCEKPLTTNIKQANKLYNLAKKNNVMLYVDDVEMFKNKKIIFKLNNFIQREKKDQGKNSSLIERLFYHDAYLIYYKLRNRKIRIKKQDCKGLKFQLSFDNKTFNFFYSIKSNIRIHKINNTNFLSFKDDPLKKMIFYVLYKLKNYSENKNRSIFALKMCNVLKKLY
tara:strand:- start:3811 stop:4536 length:726 start_codon:yes stop_codon:yes gene_type:complete